MKPINNRRAIVAVSALLVTAVATPGFAMSISLTGTVRDFSASHPDMEYRIADDLGIVQSNLGADGKPVYAGTPTTATTNGQAAFDQWYRDVPGVNQSMSHSITLNDPDNDGVFTYADNTFFPIDHLLLGNEGRSHNYHFTYELHSQFTYVGGEVFSFAGDDDLWVFIDDQLAIDIGGVHPVRYGSVSLDTLGLTVGDTYDFDLFFAERHTVKSNFRIDTSMVLTAPATVSLAEPNTLGLLAVGLFGVVACRRRLFAGGDPDRLALRVA